MDLRRYAMPVLAGLGAGAATILVVRLLEDETPIVSRFGFEVLRQAQADLGVTASSNPQRVAAMLATYGVAAGSDWCAAAVGTWIRQAANVLGVAAPIAGSAGAKATMDEFQKAGSVRAGWVNADYLRRHPGVIAVGMVPVWQRGAAGDWRGHIGVVSKTDGRGGFASIEGNTPSVAENAHSVTSAALLGMGYFVDGTIFVGGVA